MPREPQVGDALTTELFPGSGFEPWQQVSEDELNAYAESVGWTCRFECYWDGVAYVHLVYADAR